MADSPRIAELKRRVQSDPASIAFAALAEEYRRAGRHEEAIATCRHGLQRHPSYISAHVTLGRALLEMGDFEEAKTELELVLSVAPENLAAIRGLAEIHHRRGERRRSADFSAADLAETTEPPAPTSAPAPVAEERAPRDEPDPPRIQLKPAAPLVEKSAPREGPEPARVELPPPVDPSLAPLEAFLEAILRVRGSSQGAHLS